MNTIIISNMTVNYKTDNLGIDSIPYFSWNYSGDYQNFKQKSYQITVMSENGKTFYDSGEILSDCYINIKYEGKSLTPRSTYNYFVTIKSKNNLIIKSDMASFETGKLSEKWVGKWITAGNIIKPDLYHHSPYLRTSFTIEEPIKQARLYITGLGYFEAYINGQKTGDDILSPSFTNYDHTIEYLTYDVTNLLEKGENVLGALLGNGWYNCFTKDQWHVTEVSWRHVPKMIAELRIITESSKEIIIKSDSSWKSINSPITFNSIRNGEYYDANLEIDHWNTTECNDNNWDNARLIRTPGGKLTAMELEPIKIDETLTPVKFWKTDKDSWIFDMGRNIAGYVKLYAKGNKGDQLTIIYNEKLMADGINLNRKANSGFTKSGEFQTDKYTKKSDALEIWSPHFAYHGFQYIEIIGLNEKPDINTVEAIQIHTALERKGSITTSDATLNEIIKMSHYSTMSNFFGLVTDCPHREKNSWTGDSCLSSEQTMLNYSTVLAFKKWLQDIKDAQRPSGCIPCVIPSTGWGYNWGNGPDWSSALTLIPWYLYIYYEDKQILEEMYDCITKHCDYMESMADQYIVDYGIGDWCAPFEGPAISINMSKFKAPSIVTDTAYFYNAADVISKMATVLDKKDDVIYYNQLKSEIKKAFKLQFFNKETMTVSGNCQTSTACMLFQGLADEDEVDGLVNTLLQTIKDTDNHLDFGILGNKYVMNALGQSGHFDTGMEMVLQKTFPSFANIIEQGATSLWETWNGTGSLNHHMFSDLSASLYKYLGGIHVDENSPGFKHIFMSPCVDGRITSVNCEFCSVRGKYINNWSNDKEKLSMEITIPYDCSATLQLPKKYSQQFDAYCITSDQNSIYIELKAGTHTI